MLAPLLAGLGLGLSLIVAIGAQNLFVLRQGLRREHVLAVAAICAASDAALILLGVSGIGLVLQAVPWLVDAVRWAGAIFLIAYGLLAARRAWRPSGAALDTGAAPDSGAALDDVSGDPTDTTPASPSSTALHAGRADSGADTGADRDAATRAIAAPAAAASPARADVHAPVAPTAPTRLWPVVLTCLALTWLNPHVYLDTVFLLGTVASMHGNGRWFFAAGAMTASLVWFFGLAFGARLLGRWLSTPRAWRVLDAVIAVVMIALGVSLVLPAAS